MKRKCTKTVAGCILCNGASVKCSLLEAGQVSKSGEKDTDPQEMATWLSVCLNESTSPDGKFGAGNPTVVSVNTPPTENVLSPSPAQPAGRQLVDAYFRHIHRSYPFLDRTAILKEVDSMLGLSEGFEHMSRKLYLVMAIGCTTLRRIGRVSDELCAKFKISGHDILQDCLSKNDIESIEELLLLALYTFFDPLGLSPWITTGIITRQIMSMGLARKLSSSHGFTLSQVETRHRLFWSIYSLDRVVSVSTGLPFGFADTNTNIPLPGICLEEYASPDREYFTVTLQVNRHIINLRQLESSILELIHFVSPHKLTHSDRRALMADLRTKIEDWYTQGCLVNPLERDNIPFHNTILWLNCRYQSLLLLLYMPSALNYELSNEHLHVFQSAAMKHIQLSKVLFQQRHLPLNWVTLCRLVALCPMLLYIVIRSSTGILISVKESAVFCGEILEAFNESWLLAKKAAGVFRLFDGISEAQTPNTATGINIRLDINKAQLHMVLEEARDLIEETMGRSSLYCGVLDAASYVLSENRNDFMTSTWSTSNTLNQDFWMDDATQWEDVGMS